MSIQEAKKRIRSDEEYNLSRITKERLFPWAKSIITIRTIVKRDFQGENVLKAIIGGTGRGTDYKIKGSNIIKFLDKYGHGFMMSIKEKIK